MKNLKEMIKEDISLHNKPLTYPECDGFFNTIFHKGFISKGYKDGPVNLKGEDAIEFVIKEFGKIYLPSKEINIK